MIHVVIPGTRGRDHQSSGARASAAWATDKQPPRSPGKSSRRSSRRSSESFNDGRSNYQEREKKYSGSSDYADEDVEILKEKLRLAEERKELEEMKRQFERDMFEKEENNAQKSTKKSKKKSQFEMDFEKKWKNKFGESYAGQHSNKYVVDI